VLGRAAIHGLVDVVETVRDMQAELMSCAPAGRLAEACPTGGSVPRCSLRRKVRCPPPGFVEADLVAHYGSVARGSFMQTLAVTDIATGWTECAPVLVREQSLLLTAVLGEIRKLLHPAVGGEAVARDGRGVAQAATRHWTPLPDPPRHQWLSSPSALKSAWTSPGTFSPAISKTGPPATAAAV
jgi:hypothetical protein